MTRFSSFLALPTELTVRIVALAAVDDLAILVSVAQTCKQLCALVSDDGVWCEVHLLKYDHPDSACAFPTPRGSYDWRRRMIDRDFTAKFLQVQRVPEDWKSRKAQRLFNPIRLPPLSPLPPALVEGSPRVLESVLDLYLDLPRPGSPSRNVPILAAMLKCDVLAFICDHFSRSEVAQHLLALFVHIPSFNPPLLDSTSWHNFLDYHHPLNDTPTETLVDGKTFWWGVQSDVTYASCEFVDGIDDPRCYDLHINNSLLARAVDGIDAIRGTGLLGLAPSIQAMTAEHQASTTRVWDWPQVAGQWYGVNSALEVMENCRSRVLDWEGTGFDSLGVFELIPTSQHPMLDMYHEWAATGEWHPNLVAASPRAVHSQDCEHNGQRPWPYFALTPSAEKNVAPLLSPVYFVGRDTPGMSGSLSPSANGKSGTGGSKFICGVVSLTRDSPPELQWDLAIETRDAGRGGLPQRVVVRGVQPGGLGAPRGVFAVWKTWNDEFRHNPIDYHSSSDGMVWFWKTDGKADTAPEPRVEFEKYMAMVKAIR